MVCLLLISGCGFSEDEDDNCSSPCVSQLDSGTVLVSWIPPTENTDGSPLIDLAGYRVYYGTSPGNYNFSETVNNPGLSSVVVEGLATSRNWYFVVTAYSFFGRQSPQSAEVSIFVR